MRFELIPWISISGQIWMQVFVTMALVYLLWKYRRDYIALLFILLSFPRAFMFYGSTAHNLYKVAMLLLCIYFFYQLHAQKIYQRREVWIAITFALFSLQFMASVLIFTENTITIVVSQYARYLEIFLLYMALFHQDLLLQYTHWSLC